MTKLKEKETHTTTKIVTSDDGKKTFSFSKYFDGQDGKHAVFVLLYPTRTEDNCFAEDSTNMHLLKHLPELGISSYTVVNLFSIVTKSRLSTRGLQPDTENLDYIQENIFNQIDDNTVVVIAWGNSHITSSAVNESKKQILQFWLDTYPNLPLYHLTTNGMEKGAIGVHPLHMGIRYNNALWELKTFPVQKEIKELKNRLTPKVEITQKAKSPKEVKRNGKKDLD